MPAPETPRASILHVDLDAFYVSMEFLRHPELRGTPVIVGGLGERGVVTTCSYEARRYGVHSAMPMARARRLCPNATYLPSDFAYYAPASKRFHEILAEYTPAHEPAGADEAYLDVAGSRLPLRRAADICCANPAAHPGGARHHGLGRRRGEQAHRQGRKRRRQA
ncbi:MAG: hypothetical protein U5Q44_12945 [Dehalococcoidia bacterium]|nr:hypothetical protein [Dehalococcoidia bacterium]